MSVLPRRLGLTPSGPSAGSPSLHLDSGFLIYCRIDPYLRFTPRAEDGRRPSLHDGRPPVSVRPEIFFPSVSVPRGRASELTGGTDRGSRDVTVVGLCTGPLRSSRNSGDREPSRRTDTPPSSTGGRDSRRPGVTPSLSPVKGVPVNFPRRTFCKTSTQSLRTTTGDSLPSVHLPSRPRLRAPHRETRVPPP